MEEAEGIFEQAERLKRLLDTTITCNKIWVPRQGVVTLWEVKEQHED